MIDWVRVHPIETTILLANAIVNGLRFAWPDQDKRPPLVMFLLGFLDPIALNPANSVNQLRRALK